MKAGLIKPLNEYAKAYGWDKSYTPETLQQFEWTNDGKTFGEGTLWGVAQSGHARLDRARDCLAVHGHGNAGHRSFSP